MHLEKNACDREILHKKALTVILWQNLNVSVYPDSIIRAIPAANKRDSFEDSNAAGTAASFECGCFARFFLRVDDATGYIERAGFRTNGCGYMVASAQEFVQTLNGKNLQELHGLEPSELKHEVLEKLGEFPEERIQCCEVAIEAVSNAFKDHRQRLIEEFSGEKALVCTCFGISEETVENLIRDKRLNSVSEVSAICNAGSGCGSCHFLIQEMIDFYSDETLVI
jgi:NifU-like protein